MSEGRFPPSAKRRAAAREEGQVAVSGLLTGALALAAAIGALRLTSDPLADHLREVLRHGLAGAVSPGTLLEEATAALRATLAPIGVAVFAVALLVGIAQTGGLVTLVPLRPRLRARAGTGALRIVATLALTLAGLALAARAEGDSLLAAFSTTGAGGFGIAVAALTRIGLRFALLLALAGGVDHLLRRLDLERRLRVTRGEAQREGREESVDPRLLGEQRRRSREP